MQELLTNLIYILFFVRCFVNYVVFRDLCDWMQFEIDCAKSHHRIISEGLIRCISREGNRNQQKGDNALKENIFAK